MLSPHVQMGADACPLEMNMPLTSQARMGLLAFGIVGGGALILAIIVGIVVASGSSKDMRPSSQTNGNEDGKKIREDKGTGKRLADKPLSSGNKDDDEAYILGHRWWKSPPTRSKLADLVAYLIETDKGYAVYIGEAGEFCRNHSGIDCNAKIGKRRIYYDVEGVKRLTRAEVLQSLRERLDTQEFKDGAGR